MRSFKIIGLLVLEKKLFKGFNHILAWRQSWSCDLDHLYTLSFSLPKENSHEMAFIGQVVLEKKMFENNGYVHLYSPGAGADNPLG